MAASVLNSERAVKVTVFIVRAFVALRRAISQHKELANKIAQLERRLNSMQRLVLREDRELSEIQPGLFLVSFLSGFFALVLLLVAIR